MPQRSDLPRVPKADPAGPPKRAVLNEPLITERGSPGRIGYSLPVDDIPARESAQDLPPRAVSGRS